MKKISTMLFLVIAFIVSYAHHTLADIPERITNPVPKGVKIKFHKDFDYGYVYIRRFVIQGESVDEWSEAFEIINAYKILYPKTPQEYYKSMLEDRKKICSNVDASIIDQTPDSIIYEINSKNCLPFSDEHSLTKVLYGNTNIFTIIYTIKSPNITQETREAWLRSLSTTFLLPAIITK